MRNASPHPVTPALLSANRRAAPGGCTSNLPSADQLVPLVLDRPQDRAALSPVLSALGRRYSSVDSPRGRPLGRALLGIVA